MAKRIGANRRMKMVTRKRKAPKKALKALKRTAVFIGITAIALGLAVLAFFGAQKTSGLVNAIDLIKVKRIEVRGVEQIDTAQVLVLAAIKPGISMIDVKKAEIRKRIQKNQWVAKVQIRRKIPHTVVITVVERKPVAFINLGSICMVDKTGYLWPLAPHTYWNLPLISGLADTLTKKGHYLKQEETVRLNAFLDDMRRADSNTPLRISQIDFNQDNSVCVKLESSPVRAMIKCNSVGKDMDNIQEILRMIEERAEKMPKYINLCYNNLAFVQ
jgi:cell division septal protein FtsQ